MCKKCENLEQLAHKIQKAVKKLALKPDESLKDHLIDFLRDNADFWHNQSEWWRERSDFWRDEHPESPGNNFDGDRLHNDMGFIAGKESQEPSPQETPKPKRGKRIGTKTEIKKFRALLDNPKNLWNDLNGLEGGAQ